MIKNIVIGILLFLMFTLVIFSFIKATDAEKAIAEAEKQHIYAHESAKAAEAQQRLAVERAAEAEREKARADLLQNELKKCQGK